jgi:hypothetical protein
MRVDKSATVGVTAFLGLCIVLVLALIASLRIIGESPKYSCSVASVPVERGDTIYSIVREHCSGNVDEVTGLLVRMYGTRIDTWQTVHLPIASE